MPSTTTYALLSTLAASSALAKQATHKQTLTNDKWAGVVNFDEDIVEVSGDIIVPDCTPGLPYAHYADYTTDGWVGMNGWDEPPAANYTVNGGLLQTGITCNADATYHPHNYSYTRDPTSYQVWTEYAPHPPIYFDDHDFQPGDRVYAAVRKISNSSGATYIENTRTGKIHTHLYTDEKYPLYYKTNAEWITETETTVIPHLGFAAGTLTANFTEWRFEHAQYLTGNGKLGFEGGHIWDSTDLSSWHHWTLPHHLHLAGPIDTIDCILNGTTIAKGYNPHPGLVVVKNTTPSNFTLNI